MAFQIACRVAATAVILIRDIEYDGCAGRGRALAVCFRIFDMQVADLRGDTADLARLRYETISVTGLTVPAGLVPEWAAGLVPGEVTLDVAFEGNSSAISGLSGSFAMDDLCRTLENALGQVVLDETHLTGTYRIDLRVASPATIIDGLREIGLDVTPARREIDVLVVGRKFGSGSGVPGF